MMKHRPIRYIVAALMLASFDAASVAAADGSEVTKATAKVVQLSTTACDGGDMAECANLGRMYEEGGGVAKDATKAAQLYAKACDGGEMLGCSNLGVMNANGTGVAKDAAKAEQLYAKACDGQNMQIGSAHV